MRFLLMLAGGLFLSTGVASAQDSALSALDSDSDGKVSVKEFADYASGKLNGFSKLDEFAKKVDADGDGEISETEFTNRHEALSEMAEAMQAGEEETGALKVGDQATDFELQSIGKTIKLSDNFGEEGNPVVVVFSRANW